MVSLAWIAVGAAVAVVILVLGVRINRKKSTARLALRLAEAYRSRGAFEIAGELYEVPGRLDQNLPEAREGVSRAKAGVRDPVIDEALLAASVEQLESDRDALEHLLARREVEVALPPIPADPSEPEGTF